MSGREIIEQTEYLNVDELIVSFGAIGYPRAGGEFLRYGIWDTDAGSLEFVKLQGPLLQL